MKVVIKNNEYTKGELIKIMREWSEKTQKEFAKDIGKSEISIQKYEADAVNYGIQTLLDLARKNHITITFEKKIKVLKLKTFFVIVVDLVGLEPTTARL